MRRCNQSQPLLAPAGLAGVRALAGLGCAGSCACAAPPMSGLMDTVRPWMVLVGGVALVGLLVYLREIR